MWFDHPSSVTLNLFQGPFFRPTGTWLGAAQRPIALIDAIETPWCIGLRGVERHDRIFFHVCNSEILAQCFGISFRHLNCEAVEGILIDLFKAAAMVAGEF